MARIAFSPRTLTRARAIGPGCLKTLPTLHHPSLVRSHSSKSKMPHTLTVESLNPAILEVEYAVRGELAIKAEQYRNQLKEGDHGLPFGKVISSNIGNPQQKGLDQPSLTFPRQVSPTPPTWMLALNSFQVAALTEWPTLMDVAPDVFPADVKARARELLEEIGSIGAYSHSQGVPLVRKSVAKFIEGASIPLLMLS
jgi:alanine transaminase